MPTPRAWPRLVLSIWILVVSIGGIARLWDLEDHDRASSAVESRQDGEARRSTSGDEGQDDPVASGDDGDGSEPGRDPADSQSGSVDAPGPDEAPPEQGGGVDGAGQAGSGDGTPAVTPGTPLRGQIVFSSSRGSDDADGSSGRGYNLWVMAPDGGDPRQLTTTSHDVGPSLSRDGAKIAWVSRDVTVSSMRADGTDRRELARCPSTCRSVAWSPDGGRIAFVSVSDRGGDVVTMSADGANQVPLGAPFDALDVAWSPDGQRLAVAAGGTDRFRGLWVIDLAAGVRRQIRAGATHGPAWSPDGSRILFSNGTDLHVIGPQGGTSQRVTSGQGLFVRGAWSPDGTTIVADHYPGSGGVQAIQIWVMRADGSEARQITNGPGAAFHSTF